MAMMVSGAEWVNGVGACTTINTRGLLDTLAIRAQVGSPAPDTWDDFVIWLRESTLHGLRSLLIDRVSPLMTLATGTAFYRLGPYVAHTLAMLGLDPSSALFPVAFYTATDVLHTLPTVPLRNSAIHRVLEEKPIEGVCLRLRSGPESVSRTAAEHVDSALRSFRGLRMLVLERLVFHVSYAASSAVLKAAVRAAFAIESPYLDAVALLAATAASYPFELLRNFMVVAELDEASAFIKVWERENLIREFWSGFAVSLPRLLLRPLEHTAQHHAEVSLVRRWGFGEDSTLETGTPWPTGFGGAPMSLSAPPPGLAIASGLYRSMQIFGASRCGIVVWDRVYSWPDIPSAACGVLPLVGLAHASVTANWMDVVSGLSLEQYYTVFMLGTLLQGAWKLAAIVG